MSLNPIVALSEQLQKLINERGSAAILRDHLALFKDKIILLEQKASSLESENTVLKAENEKLKSESANLRLANNELAAKIQSYEKPAQGNLLDEIKVKILLHLSKQTSRFPEDDIGSKIGISQQVALFHVEELTRQFMVHRSSNPFGGAFYLELSHNGRRYLIEHNLM